MFKPSTIIPLTHDLKNNTVYMVDVTTKKVYSQFKDFSKINTNISTVLSILLFVILSTIAELFRPNLYLDQPSQSLKGFLVLMSILIGFLMFCLVRKKSYKLQLDEYLQQIPPPEEVDNIEEILDKAHLRSLIIILTTAGLLIASINVYGRFLNNVNLGTYIMATMLFILFTVTTLAFKNSIFILKLTKEKKSKVNGLSEIDSEINETSTPKKHPWEDNQDENEIFRAKMLKLESEMNSKNK